VVEPTPATRVLLAEAILDPPTPLELPIAISVVTPPVMPAATMTMSLAQNLTLSERSGLELA
jgi:hypothetical protein